jgi:hypothetical protein
MTSFREIELRPGEEAMIQSARIHGVLAPVVTPFKADLLPDSQRFIAHCKGQHVRIFSPFISDVS